MIKTIDLFPELNAHLFHLLKGLKNKDWEKPTCLQGRTVKDIVSHLLDAGCLRRLSAQRDGYHKNNQTINSLSDLVKYIQQSNIEWITATKKLSPRILISLLEIMEKELYDFLKTLDPNKIAYWPVAWAGQKKSFNWFDIARDYTEKWHHQMQIRDAVNKPGIFEPKYVLPIYETFMIALPFAYRDIAAEDKTLVKIHISGKCGGTWFLYRNMDQWELTKNQKGQLKAEVIIEDIIAWKLFTNSIRKNKTSYLKIKGNSALGEKISEMVTVLS